jgi:predicted transcriptional regulator
LAKKYYREKAFKNAVAFNNIRKKMSNDITTTMRTLKSQKRVIKYHDISTCRDIIIAVDRFFEMFMKKHKDVQIVDLILIATAKYLMDFYDIEKKELHIVTMDNALYDGARKITEIPIAYDPTRKTDSVKRIFE